MAITAQEFDARVPDWQDWQSTPWGHLYYRMTRANLQRHLPPRRLRILDVGGGNGGDTRYYAALGHQVTMLDYSPAMLAEAQRRATQEGVADAITFVEMDADKLADTPSPALPGGPFDLALCHLMIEFTPRPQAMLCGILPYLAPGGLLSLVDANRYSEVYRRAFQPCQPTPAEQLADAATAIEQRQYRHPWFDRQTPVFSAQEMIDLFESAGAQLAGQYGVRCLCDYLPNEMKYEPDSYAQLEALELQLAGQYPYYLLARFYHLIIQRP